MKRFGNRLLPLGALLLITALPVQASAAEQVNCNLNDLLKYNAKITCVANASCSQLFEKWSAGNENCQKLFQVIWENCQKPNKPNTPDVPDVQEPEQPDTPDVPDVQEPEQPDTPDVPDVQEPEQPDTPDVPDVQEPEQPDTPDVPDVQEPEKPSVQKPGNSDGNQSAGSVQLGSYEQQVVELVNKERAAAGLPALSVNAKLSQVAETKAEDMRDKNYFSHTSPTYGSPFDMMKQFGITYKSAGENIAKGQKTPESVMNGWMNSQGHRENILNANYTEIGVGYVTDSKGNTYWVQMFIRP